MTTMNTLKYIETGLIDFSRITNNFTDIYKQFDKQLFTAGAVTGNGASAASTIIIAIIPFSSWRVIDCGFVVENAGASTVAEKVTFGLALSDASAADVDYFGICSQDTTAGEQLGAGDCIKRSSTLTYLVAPDAPANAGTHPWTDGDPVGFAAWQTKQGMITVTKSQVGSSTATVRAWVLVEIGDV